MTASRQPQGTPAGGQFAAVSRPEAEVVIGSAKPPFEETLRNRRGHDFLPPDVGTWCSSRSKQPLVKKEERIDDIAFLLETGCGKAEVLKRSGFTSYEAFERLCYRLDRADLIARFKAIGDRTAA